MEQRTRVLGRRIAAFVLDLAVVLGPLVLVFLGISDTAPAGSVENGSNFIQVTIGGTERYVAGDHVTLIAALFGMLALVVFVALPAGSGASPGMRALGLRVVGEDGGSVSVGRHLGRSLLWVVDAFPYFIPGGIAFLVAMTNPRRQRVGDIAAHTLVVRAGS